MQKKAALKITFIALFVLGILALATLHEIRQPDHTAVWRGRQVAQKMGCFSCHGFEGSKGISNPGYKYDRIPSWQGGTAMMFLHKPGDLKSYILYGKPVDKKEKTKGLIKMPGFKDKISNGALSDLMIYLRAVMQTIPIDDEIASAGFDKMSNLGCFGCHGPYGMGGMPNPKSFKRYTPGWDGSDFEDMVENDEELHQWIADGKIDRFDKNRFATYFTSRQIIKMPAYGKILREGEIDTLAHYVKWLRKQNFELDSLNAKQ